MPQETTAPRSAAPEHVDVLVVGAGISGVGAAWHLTHQCPDKSFLVLEALESFGGTWLMHRYPGIRSDSDLYTFGYRFKPWVGPPIATAAEILKYMGEVIEENGLGSRIRYRHRIDRASYSSAAKLWTVDVTRTDTGESLRVTANLLWMCQGYYEHAKGYAPEWPGMDAYEGRIVHPQTWPDDIDLKGKKVICIGSGATTATVVPAIANEVEHVTVLQRSPTYFFPGRNAVDIADQLRVLKIDEAWIHEIVRRQRLHEQAEITRLCVEMPDFAKDELIKAVAALLPEGYDVATHFTPKYRPWQQRIAFVPDGDLFAGIRSGKASMVTDEIERFTKTGVRLKSGRELEADIVITATGFNLSVMGGIPFDVDGKPVDWSRTVTYRGMMFTDVPNLVWIFGYFRASWTLRVDLVADFVCRLLKHMDAKGAAEVRVAIPPEDAGMAILPWMDPENFNPGYLMRRQHLLPKRGAKPEWQHTQDYWREKDELPAIDLDDPAFVYAGRKAPTLDAGLAPMKAVAGE